MSRRRSLIELIEQFWTRVDTSGECWLWNGEVNNKGYGIYSIYEGDGREKILAHRFSALMSGMQVHSPRDVVMHSCDTPPCVRPSHLSVGTQRANLHDALAKNRMNLAGLVEPTPRICQDCGVEFLGAGNTRYCPTHRAGKKWSA